MTLSELRDRPSEENRNGRRQCGGETDSNCYVARVIPTNSNPLSANAPRRTSTSGLRYALGAAVTVLLVALTGCAAEEISPTPSPTESPRESARSTESPRPASTSEATPDAAFTSEELIELCIEKTETNFPDAPEFLTAEATIESVESDHPWFILVPVGGDFEGWLTYCTIGGTPVDPSYQLHGAAIASMEQEIREWAGAAPKE
ncbi:hypothetical protein [Microbacterium galbinum]|uniref:Uncharacterized protein n=1 Tax=Microbacterium galbinum TaxID=2851646 RepID=A0ABY4IK62_9MICO|nr:hypothetical protein [Microbacterium galbinum]UPL12997.1 hypothetical protein KV396_00165 [Microbacterium galbinum]